MEPYLIEWEKKEYREWERDIQNMERQLSYFLTGYSVSCREDANLSSQCKNTQVKVSKLLNKIIKREKSILEQRIGQEV